MSIVKNSRVRRDKADISVPDFVSDIKDLSSRYAEAAQQNGQHSLKLWEAIKSWDETQVSTILMAQVVGANEKPTVAAAAAVAGGSGLQWQCQAAWSLLGH
jgi:hypothetical protein